MHCVLDLYVLLNNSHNRVDSEFPSDGAGWGGGGLVPTIEGLFWQFFPENCI